MEGFRFRKELFGNEKGFASLLFGKDAFGGWVLFCRKCVDLSEERKIKSKDEGTRSDPVIPFRVEGKS
jgi:hypothetical protein